MIREAKLYDMIGIMEIVKEATQEMHSHNNYQWDENYPLIEDFTKDIETGTLYVFETEKTVAGFICINKEEPLEYKDLKWKLNQEAFIIHRMAIRKSFRWKGIGSKLVQFADNISIENNVNYIRTDTYSLNIKAQSLLKKCGYTFTGKMRFLGKEKEFYCFERVIK